MRLYRALVVLLRLVARAFFRQIEVVGLEHVPPEGSGAVLFAGNLPNSLIDPVLVIAFSGRIVHFAAKDVLFKSRLLRFFLDGLGAVPVSRKADHGDVGGKNDQAFDAMHRVLGQGKAVGIFPEGLSHDEAQLARLKTGAARIALGACAANPGLKIHIIPVGLNYIQPKRFRTRVLVQFGPPIIVEAPAAEPAPEETRTAARELTDRLELNMRALTVNAEDWDTLRVLDGVRRLYQPPGVALEERVELARRFASVYPSVKHQPEVQALYAGVADYQARLDEVGLTDRDVRRGFTPGDAALRLWFHALLLLVWAPLAIPGSIVHAPVGVMAALAGRTLTPRKDVVGTTKLVAGLVGCVLGYVALVAIAALSWGALAGFLALVLLPLTGYATLRVVDRTGAIRRYRRTTLRLFRLGDDIDFLVRTRRALEGEVLRAVERFKPESMVALFPRVAPPAPIPEPYT